MNTSSIHQKIKAEMDAIAPVRERWITRNRYYHDAILQFLRMLIPSGSSILDIGCGTGTLLSGLEPSRGVGIDISDGMIDIARKKNPNLHFEAMAAEELDLSETFDYILIVDTIGYFVDIQEVMRRLHSLCKSTTRLIILNPNFLWVPFLAFAERFGLKMPATRSNWLGLEDTVSLLSLEGYDVIRRGRRMLLPFNIPRLSAFVNNCAPLLPLTKRLCLVNYVVARPVHQCAPLNEKNVSVIIPARNERGNIEEAILRMPRMGSRTEIVFVEGNSTDGTWEMIQAMAHKYKDTWSIVTAQQEGKGKADAVRKGFSLASGDLLMILDADLTVPPEDLPKFYRALASGEAEFASGSRMVYPMEKQSMRTLNVMGNKLFSIAFSWILDQRIKDTLCGTKVLSRAAWERICQNRHVFGEFDPFGDFDLIFGAARLNLKMVEIPVRYRARHYGTTNISRFTQGWLLLRMAILATRKFKWT